MADFKVAVRFRNGIVATYECLGASNWQQARAATISELGEANLRCVLVSELTRKQEPVLEPLTAA